MASSAFMIRLTRTRRIKVHPGHRRKSFGKVLGDLDLALAQARGAQPQGLLHEFVQLPSYEVVSTNPMKSFTIVIVMLLMLQIFKIAFRKSSNQRSRAAVERRSFV